MDQMKRCAIYARVSTDKQTTDNQRPALVQMAQARGWEIAEVFEEVGSSAKARPVFDRLLLGAHQGRYQVILVAALDRVGRSMVGNITSILSLDAIGVQVVSLREPWLDTQGPVRPLLLAIFGWIAEQERLQLVERVKAGLDRARREGKHIGRRPIEVDLGKALAFRSNGLSIRKAARELGCSSSKLHSLLQSHDEIAAATAGSAPVHQPLQNEGA